jgi:hypothetical protein
MCVCNIEANLVFLQNRRSFLYFGFSVYHLRHLTECVAAKRNILFVCELVVLRYNQWSSCPLASPEEICSIKGCIWSVWMADLVYITGPPIGRRADVARPRRAKQSRHEYKLKPCGFLHWVGHYDS